MKMQHFDMKSTVLERGESLLYISVKKSFLTFWTFSPIWAYISLSVIDNMVPFYTDAHIWNQELSITSGGSSRISPKYINLLLSTASTYPENFKSIG